MERTLVIVKPDGVARGLIGRIIQRFEDAGMKVIGMKLMNVSKEHADAHYDGLAERVSQKVFDEATAYMSEGPVLAFVLEGVGVIAAVRKIAGTTEPFGAAPGTIRGDFAHENYNWGDSNNKSLRNLVHASGNAEEAAHEIKLWFADEDIHDYKTVHQIHTFGH